MPVSSSVQISHCLEEIILLNPASVLDIGCGFGLWGFLCREYLDVWNGRVQPHEWRARIEGVELWEPYIQSHQRALYDQIHIGDVRTLLPALGEYDLVIAGDVIEHLEKPAAEWVLEQLYERAQRAMILNIPLAGNWDHPEQYSNPGELHRSQWTAEDFGLFPGVYKIYNLPCGEYGSFYFEKNADPAQRVAGLIDAAERRRLSGDLAGCERALLQACTLAPATPDPIVPLVDHYLQMSDIPRACQLLEDALPQLPEFHYGVLTLARILALQGRRADAMHRLQGLLASETVPHEIRVGAEDLAMKL